MRYNIQENQYKGGCIRINDHGYGGKEGNGSKDNSDTLKSPG